MHTGHIQRAGELSQPAMAAERAHRSASRTDVEPTGEFAAFLADVLTKLGSTEATRPSSGPSAAAAPHEPSQAPRAVDQHLPQR